MKKTLLTILLFCYTICAFSQHHVVNFVVNTNEYIRDSAYIYFINVLCPYIAEHSEKIDKIILIGSASPEGNKQLNERLANIRANTIYSYISDFISKEKLIINNDYNLFLYKTGYNEKDYSKLRATYIEVHLKEDAPKTQVDTIWLEKRDTIPRTDTLYINNSIYKKKCNNLIFSVYHNLGADLIKAPGIGIEFYSNQLGFFIEGTFANTTLIGKKFNCDLWHIGFRKYFNNNYDKVFIELYGRSGYFDTELFNNGVFGIPFGIGIGFGWKFSFCSHVKLYPLIRFGYDYIKFMDYYSKDVSTIGVTFGKYYNYKDDSNTNIDESSIYISNRTINKYFFNNSKTLHWFGPSYIGLIIQIDIHKLKN